MTGKKEGSNGKETVICIYRLPKPAIFIKFSILWLCIHLPSPIRVKYGTRKRTPGILYDAKFDHNRYISSPILAKNTKNMIL